MNSDSPDKGHHPHFRVNDGRHLTEEDLSSTTGSDGSSIKDDTVRVPSDPADGRSDVPAMLTDPSLDDGGALGSEAVLRESDDGLLLELKLTGPVRVSSPPSPSAPGSGDLSPSLRGDGKSVAVSAATALELLSAGKAGTGDLASSATIREHEGELVLDLMITRPVHVRAVAEDEDFAPPAEDLPKEIPPAVQDSTMSSEDDLTLDWEPQFSDVHVPEVPVSESAPFAALAPVMEDVESIPEAAEVAEILDQAPVGSPNGPSFDRKTVRSESPDLLHDTTGISLPSPLENQNDQKAAQPVKVTVDPAVRIPSARPHVEAPGQADVEEPRAKIRPPQRQLVSRPSSGLSAGGDRSSSSFPVGTPRQASAAVSSRVPLGRVQPPVIPRSPEDSAEESEAVASEAESPASFSRGAYLLTAGLGLAAAAAAATAVAALLVPWSSLWGEKPDREVKRALPMQIRKGENPLSSPAPTIVSAVASPGRGEDLDGRMGEDPSVAESLVAEIRLGRISNPAESEDVQANIPPLLPSAPSPSDPDSPVSMEKADYEVREVLASFLSSLTSDERRAFLLPTQLGETLPGPGDESWLSEFKAELFETVTLERADRQRGMHLLLADPQGNAADAGENRLGRGTLAMFKRGPLGEWRMDWPLFRQTAKAEFSAFCSQPTPGEEVILRVSMMRRSGPGSGMFLVRLAPPHGDPSAGIIFQAPVNGRFAEVIGEELQPDDAMTATVKLAWNSGQTPTLELRSLICREFLGIGITSANPIAFEGVIASLPASVFAPRGQAMQASGL